MRHEHTGNPSNRSRPGGWTHVVVVLATLVAIGGLGACGGGSQPSGEEPTAPPAGQSSVEAPTPSPDTQTTEEAAEPWSYGDDPALDELWDSCAAGDGGACDELYNEAAAGSDYESFADTCGGRLPEGTECAEQDLTGATGQGSTESAGDVDLLCSDAVSALEDLPPRNDDSDAAFAAEEYGTSQILRDLADNLDSAGATDLSASMAGFAQAHADLAVAYDQGSYDAFNQATGNLDQAAARVKDAAAAIGSTKCAELTLY